MSLDPTVAVALVNSAGGLLSTLLERLPWGNGADAPKKKARRVIDGNYEVLCRHLTDHCVQILVLLEDGQNRAPSQLVGKIFPVSGNHSVAFINEFDYRFKFLCILGLLTSIGSGVEYAITRLGNEFLAVAREKGRPYGEVLFREK